LAISLSLVLILAVGVGFLVRYMGLRVWHALICAAFGFTLAATSIAPQISQTLNGIVRILSGHG
jgi:membrane protein YdbS with pleckstrin-like domain